VPALGFGTVRLGPTATGAVIELPGAWYAPAMGVNLVSTIRLGQLGLTTSFPPGDAFDVRDGRGRVVLTGRRTIAGNVLDARVIRVSDPSTTRAFAAARALAAASLHTWHHRCGHLNYPALIQLVKSGAVDGLKVTGSLAPPEHGDGCLACALGKARRLPYEAGRTRAKRPGEMFHADLFGPGAPTVDGKRYGLIITDDESAERWGFLLRSKDEAGEILQTFILEQERRFGQRIDRLTLTLRTDLGGEFVGSVASDSLARFLRSRGIRHEFAVARSPQQNGVAERAVDIGKTGSRTLLAATMCAEAGLPPKYWGFAFKSFIHAWNRVPSSANGGRIPHEAYYGERADVSHLVAWGCDAVVHEPRERRAGMLEPAGWLGTVLGYAWDEGLKGYHVLDRRTGKIVVRRDVQIRETALVRASYRSRFDAAEPEGEVVPDLPQRREPTLGDNRLATLGVESTDDDDELAPRPTEPEPIPPIEEPPAPVEPPPAPAAREKRQSDRQRGIAPTNFVPLAGAPANTAAVAVEATTDKLERLDIARASAVATSPVPLKPSPRDAKSGIDEAAGPYVDGCHIRLPRGTPSFEAAEHRPGRPRIEVAEDDPLALRAAEDVVTDDEPTGDEPEPLLAPTAAARSRRPVACSIMPRRSGPQPRRKPRIGTCPHDIVAINAIDEACGSYIATTSLGDVVTEREAFAGADAAQWRAAYNAEMAAHALNGTWRSVDAKLVPRDRKPIGSRMLFKIKRDATGEIVRYKCRLVAQGFSQRPGVDYDETFAPTAKWTSVRIACAVAAKEDLDLLQLDVDTAYLRATLVLG
jgi:transposase InsO family protein